MAATVVLGVRVIENKYERIKIENIDLDGKVEVLKNTASQKINKSTDELELIYAGMVLEDDSTLSSYGIKPGVTVHVLEKVIPNKPKETKTVSEADVLQLASTIEEYGYRAALQRIARPEVIEKIIASSPSLEEDPAAVAFLHDAELLALMADAATLRQIVDAHPSLISALSQITIQIKEDARTQTLNQASTSTGYSYSLEALSDDEDMDSSETREGNPLTRNASYNAITAAQLAAAIANATTNFSSTGAVINPPTTTPSGNNLITSEMFGSALQQAFASAPTNNFTPPTAPSPTTPNRNGEESFETIRTRLQPQLQQMQEMGLINEGQNIRALQATSGDVQAAVELVFNGVID